MDPVEPYSLRTLVVVPTRSEQGNARTVITSVSAQVVELRPGSDARLATFNLSEVGNEGLVRAIRAEGYKLIIASEECPLDLPSEELFNLNTDAGSTGI